MITILGVIMIVTTIAVASVGLMDTDMLHATIQNAVTRSFYIAEAGLEEATAQAAAAPDPATYATRDAGVTMAYGDGQFTYWVNAGPAVGCGDGFKTLEALGEVRLLNRTIPARVQACAVPGTPISTALFGVSRVEIQGAAARMYIAPYGSGTPGGGGSLGSFNEIHIADRAARINALSEVFTDLVSLRDAGTVPDYALFGFSERPDYNANPEADPAPWVLGLFGDFVKAQPKDGMLLNQCGTPYACVTGPDGSTDIQSMADLRSTVENRERNANGLQHVYMNHMRREVLPRLSLEPARFLNLAAHNTANAALNAHAGFVGKTDSVYFPAQFYHIVIYLEAHPAETLQGTVFVTGTVAFWQSVNLGGNTGNVTLAVAGDLVLGTDVPLRFSPNAATMVVNRHDLSTASGRTTPGILVFGIPTLVARPTTVCGDEVVTGSGRLVLCGRSKLHLVVDGLIYTADGMVLQPGAYLDQVGAMYHGSRGTASPSFVNQDATVLLRFDPLALSAFGTGLSILSWQQLPGPGPTGPALESPSVTAPSPLPLTTAPPLAAPAPPIKTVPPPAASGPPPAPAKTVPPPAVSEPSPPATPPPAQVPVPHGPIPAIGPGPVPAPVPAAPPAGTAHAGHPVPTPAGLEDRREFHVQAGAFRNREYAADLVRQLKARGYTVTVVEGALLRVWVGPPMNRGAAERLAATLRLSGFETTLSPVR